MGIRVNKILGYGAKHRDREYLEDALYEHDLHGEVAEFLNTAYEKETDQRKKTEIMFEANRFDPSLDYPRKFNQVVKYAEYSDADDGNFVIMLPSKIKSWYRHDNEIDYIEQSTIYGEDMSTIVRVLDSSPYPHNYRMDKNGNIINSYVHREELSQSAPYIPVPIRLIAQHFKFDWKELKPMIVSWWG